MSETATRQQLAQLEDRLAQVTLERDEYKKLY